MRGGANPITDSLASIRSTISTMMDRPFPASSPPTAPYVAQMEAKGVTDAGVPLPSDTKFQVQPYDPRTLVVSPGMVQANLPTQVRGPV